MLYFNPSNITNLYYDNILILILMSLILSLICQLGDLFISLLKGKQNKIYWIDIARTWGSTDRVDGLIFVLPFSYILHRIFL